MKSGVYICVLCACLVTLLVKSSANGVNNYIFLANADEEKEKALPVNVNNSEQMANYTLVNNTQSEWPQNNTQDITQEPQNPDDKLL